MNKHVIDDAKRCLQCKNPLCSKGCPVHTPIRDAIGFLLDGRISEAGELLFRNNPLSIICCHVCPQENQCEGYCVQGRSGSPVHISAIEQYISDFYLSIYSPVVSDTTTGKVAIIGSGPAGITIAFILSQRNYDVTIYEGNDQIGGVLRYGIPEFRLPKKYLDLLADILIKSGVKIRPNTTIGTNICMNDLFTDGYKAVFIGTGVWRPQKLNLNGESLGNVHYAIEYLHNPDVYHLGNKVTVIGAGNAAMDVARTVIRHGCHDVTIVSNMGQEHITAREIEMNYAKIDGAKIIYNKSIVEFTEKGGIFADSEIHYDECGHMFAEPIHGTESLLESNSIIIAIGQRPRAVIVSTTTGIDITSNGLVAVNEVGQTSRSGVFASGDVVTGAKTVVEAVRISKGVADAIDRYVQDLKEKD